MGDTFLRTTRSWCVAVLRAEEKGAGGQCETWDKVEALLEVDPGSPLEALVQSAGERWPDAPPEREPRFPWHRRLSLPPALLASASSPSSLSAVTLI